MDTQQPLFAVYDRTELMALWRLIAEAKFHAAPEDTDLWGSSYVHRLAQKVADAMVADYAAQGDKEAVESNLHWRASLPENIVLPVVKAQLKNDTKKSWSREATQERKMAYVQGCIAPFTADEEYIKALIEDAEVNI